MTCSSPFLDQIGQAPRPLLLERAASRVVEPLVDPFGRAVSYLRVSLTDRCNLRCHYCMAEDMTFLPKAEVLTLEEIDRLCASFVVLGTRKLRLTGGEPLVRSGVMDLVRAIGRHLKSGALDELTLTTNGTLLVRYAKELVAAGVRRVNVSLDTLDPDKFRAVTRFGQLGKVLDGIQAASDAGLEIKINAVAMKGINDGEFHRLVSWCGERGYDLTFIEIMPLGGIERSDQYIPMSEVRAALEARWTLQPSSHRSGGPARYMTVKETGQRLGFITPLTHSFCESCNRVRLTCTGQLCMCLGQDDAVDLRAPLRRSSDDGQLIDVIREAIRHKPKGHDFSIARPGAVSRFINVTGG